RPATGTAPPTWPPHDDGRPGPRTRAARRLREDVRLPHSSRLPHRSRRGRRLRRGRGAPAGGPEMTVEFTLPPALEAHEPPEARGRTRDGVRLLVSRRATGEISHHAFRDLPSLLD